MRMKLCLAILLAAFAIAAPHGQQAPQKITTVEGITEYRLANGLRVLLFPDLTKPTITVNITYLVGSADEGYGETGMAHLLEHLQFKGATGHTNIYQEMTSHGARTNATTWFDRTNYFETFPANDENLTWSLGLEADRMVNSFIAKKDLDSEMTVVRNEFERGENDPSSVLEERVFSTAFLWHNYGHSTIGARSDIEKVPIEQLQAFYRKYYQPDNAVLLVAGRFDEPRAVALVQQAFGAVPAPTRVLPKIYTQEPTQDGERTVSLRRVGDVQAVIAAFHTPAGAHEDTAAIAILNRVLSDSPSGRLYKALVETKKASEVSGGEYHLRDPGLWLVAAGVLKEQSLEEARTILLQTLDELAVRPVTSDEVDRARAALLKNIELLLNSSDRVGLQLSEWIAQGDWRLFFVYRDRLRAVSADAVNRAARTYLKASNRTVGLFIPTDKPDRTEVPSTPDVAALVKDYKGDATVAAGEAFDPSPANIESRAKRVALANGLQLALLPKKTRGGTVVATGTFRFGDEKSLFGRSTEASLTGLMLMRGTAKHTRQQIRDELDRLKARANVGGGTTQATFTIETVHDNLPATLALVAEILREPSFPAAEFDLLKQARVAQLEESRSDPQAIATLEFARHMNPFPKGDVRYRATTDEQLAEVRQATVDAARRFHTDFYGASNGQIAIVGDFDEGVVTSLIKEKFEGWKSAKPYARVPNVNHDVPPVNQTIQTPDKTNAIFIAGQTLAVRDDDADYPALTLANFMMGGGFLNSRLAVRLRQKEGLSYGVSSQLQISSLDRDGQFRGTAIYAPANVKRLETAFTEEMARVVKDGFTAEELEQARAGWLQGQTVARSQDAALATRLSNYLYLERTLRWDADLERKIAALTADQVNAAVRRHIHPEKFSVFKAGDFPSSQSRP